ncbi:phosphoheptose isomerase family protein [Carbonactinospora thermoautotrophica]|uniref:hypothetical protein n=1 Tax=Carbonactinospora thermoautotrophica TaxID=1469144 RepID=UPI001146B4C4|nr:hypothetical protein [Carbonactinospora thermoautotrophica]
MPAFFLIDGVAGHLVLVGLTVHQGGKKAGVDTIDCLFVVPSVHRIQEMRATTCHLLWKLTQRAVAAVPE